MNINDIKVDNRLRSDMGDIDGLCNSISEHSLIQPIVVSRDGNLIAGGRRLEALRRMGTKVLTEGVHFVFNDQLNPLKRKGMELEENIRRKDLSWQEVVTGKQQLLELMQSIHGQPSGGRPRAGSDGGFSVTKLAAMLGESAATTAGDLQVAEALKQFPAIGKAETKGSALTKMKIFGALASMHVTGAAKKLLQGTPGQKQRTWTLYEQDFRHVDIGADSCDLVWTDLPYGADIDSMSAHAAASQIASFNDTKLEALQLLSSIAEQSWRVLKNDRYAVFCFGFVTYTDLVFELERVGFSVNPVPVVWVKNTKSGENPTTRYCNGYEPILVAAKGRPNFIIPGQSNVITLPVESQKIQAVQKPVALVEKFLREMTGEGALVVDWCAGTGTTGVACDKLNRRSILFEKDPSMAALAKVRLEAL